MQIINYLIYICLKNHINSVLNRPDFSRVYQNPDVIEQVLNTLEVINYYKTIYLNITLYFVYIIHIIYNNY